MVVKGTFYRSLGVWEFGSLDITIAAMVELSHRVSFPMIYHF